MLRFAALYHKTLYKNLDMAPCFLDNNGAKDARPSILMKVENVDGLKMVVWAVNGVLNVVEGSVLHTLNLGKVQHVTTS